MGGFSSISLLSAAAIVTLLFSRISKAKTNGLNQSVIVVSFDGLGWEFVGSKRAKTPNFDFFASGGVKAKNLIGVHPVKTFPVHTTFMTGLYPESHGIVDNKFWDPLYMEKFILEHDCSNFDPKFYNESEPIWLTMQKRGRKTGVHYWPGSTSYSEKPSFYAEPFCYLKCEDYKGPMLEYLRLYLKVHCFFNWAKSFQKRIDTVLEWLLSKNPPQLAMLYFEQPDMKGHSNGPNSAEYINQIEAIDSDVLGYLVERLMGLQLMDKTNVIIVSDHGIIETKYTRQIRLHDYIEPDSYFKNIAAREHIWPKPRHLDEIYRKLKSAKNPHFKVYKREEIPEELHWKNNRRIPPIYVVPEEGWLLRPDWNPLAEGKWVEGTHGWPPTENSAGIFYARGPAFKEGYRSLKTKRAIDIYSLLCHVVGVEPLPNNGSLTNMMEFLKDKPQLKSDKSRVTTASNLVSTATTIKTTSRLPTQTKTLGNKWYTKATQVRQSIDASELAIKPTRSTTKGHDTKMSTLVSTLQHPTNTPVTHAQSITLKTSRKITHSMMNVDDTTRTTDFSSFRIDEIVRSPITTFSTPVLITTSPVCDDAQTVIPSKTEEIVEPPSQGFENENNSKGKYRGSRSFVSKTPNQYHSNVYKNSIEILNQNQSWSPQKTVIITTTKDQIQLTPLTQTITKEMTRGFTQNNSTPSLSEIPSSDDPKTGNQIVYTDDTRHVSSPRLDKILTSKTFTTLKDNKQFESTPILIYTSPATTDAQPAVSTATSTALTDSNHLQSAPILIDSSPATTDVQPAVSTATALTTLTDSNQFMSTPFLTNTSPIYSDVKSVRSNRLKELARTTPENMSAPPRSFVSHTLTHSVKVDDVSVDVLKYSQTRSPPESMKIRPKPTITSTKQTTLQSITTDNLQEVPRLHPDTSSKIVLDALTSKSLQQQQLTSTVAVAETSHFTENLTLKKSPRGKQLILKSSVLIVSSVQVDSSVASSSSVIRSSNISSNYTGHNMSVVTSKSSNETHSGGSGDDIDVQALIDCPPYEEEEDDHTDEGSNSNVNAQASRISFKEPVVLLIIAKLSIWLCRQ